MLWRFSSRSSYLDYCISAYQLQADQAHSLDRKGTIAPVLQGLLKSGPKELSNNVVLSVGDSVADEFGETGKLELVNLLHDCTL